MTVVRVGICFLLAWAVLAHGSVEAWAYAGLAIGAAVLFALWGLLALRQRQVTIRWTRLYLPLLVFVGLVLVQGLLSLSVYAYLTKLEGLKLATYCVLFFLGVQSFPSMRHARALVWFLLVFGFTVAVFAIIQSFAFNGKIYWFRELQQGGTPFGPYVNRNHFAGLVELIVPLGLAILFLRAARRDQLPLVGLLTVVPVGAVILSASRAGIFILFFQFALLGCLVWGRLRGRRFLTVTATVVLVVAALAAWLGVERALERFGQLSLTVLPVASRIVMAKDTWRIFLDHPWTGTGLGTFVVVYPQYASDYFSGTLVNHAHNDYVELMAEAGIIGSLCTLAFVGLLFWSATRNRALDQEPCAAATRLGAMVACSGLLLHGLVEFNFHIPSNVFLFLLLAFVASSPASCPEDRRGEPKRL